MKEDIYFDSNEETERERESDEEERGCDIFPPTHCTECQRPHTTELLKSSQWAKHDNIDKLNDNNNSNWYRQIVYANESIIISPILPYSELDIILQ